LNIHMTLNLFKNICQNSRSVTFKYFFSMLLLRCPVINDICSKSTMDCIIQQVRDEAPDTGSIPVGTTTYLVKPLDTKFLDFIKESGVF
jgi:hypothetical protein